MHKGKPVSVEEINALVQSGKIPRDSLIEIERKQAALAEKMEEIQKEIRELEKKTSEELKKLDSEAVAPIIEQKIGEMKDRYKNESVNGYLEEIKENVRENLDKFSKKQDEEAQPMPGVQFFQGDPYLEYKVNLFVDNTGSKRAPVIFETSSTYRNVFGTVEVIPDRFGTWRTDFTKIKAGSLLRADGGFLILESLDTLIEPGVWPELKRSLRNRKLEIKNYAPLYMISVSALKPESIECDVKVAMVGDPFLYNLLYARDEDFKKIFKVRADFDSVMDLEKDSIMQYASFVKKVASDEKLTPFDKSAVGVR